MDSLKANIAASVRHALFNHIRGTIYDTGSEESSSLQGAAVEIVDDLNTFIKIRTPNGPRYFLVKVSEPI